MAGLFDMNLVAPADFHDIAAVNGQKHRAVCILGWSKFDDGVVRDDQGAVAQ